MDANNLKKLALGAEIVSAIAIIVTLVFLVLETRANTAAIKDQTYQELTQQLNNYRVSVIEGDNLEIREKLLTDGWSSLSRIEQTKLLMMRHNFYAVYETAYYSRKRDVIGDAEWIRFENAICANYLTDVSRGLWGVSWQTIKNGTTLKSNLTPEFGEYIVDSCEIQD
jgi:hypothetical protein